MFILAWQTAGGELDWSRVLGFTQSRAARMAGGHGVVVRGHGLSHGPSHCTGCMNVPGMHDEHRSQGHLCPCHHGHKKGHRNVLLQHLTYESSRPRTGMP